MKTVFIGSGNFAKTIIEFLSENYDVCLVATRPDAKKGRGQKVVSSVISEFCASKNIPCYSPESINSDESVEILKKASADIAVLASYSEILLPPTINVFAKGILNIHPSLLPRYRGAEPIRWAIRKCEKETGVSLMLISNRLDRGNVIASETIAIEDTDDFGSLSEKLAKLSVSMLPEAIKKLGQGFEGEPQSQEKTFYARRLKPDDEVINWNKTAFELSCHIRSMSPDPGCYTVLDGKRIKLFGPKVVEGNGQPGEVLLSKKTLIIACKEGALEFTKCQKEGGKLLDTRDFLASGLIRQGLVF
ncbi:MAG TPA: methionyl-tRNA formyltransferase [Caldisericia bacterium]|nr:methionyl-tRNA formyltransferase [Caldisericia bacterium]HOU07948.1 methionyl-tRNA formyltransferase [Caldisericia bacterium]HPL90103.1 methionyl-tRNA formyltransferase [Caldisericia bacterium]HQG58962.1 methionyl-tRNA formyltransferase [Caldisericia bacterium]HQH49090.1 methionyl-tRNA formyltransferase [Caldisericia bacterium]